MKRSHPEIFSSPETKILSPLMKAMRGIKEGNVREALDRETIDPIAGIGIARLDKDPVEINGVKYKFFGARILPSTAEEPPYVKPHLHEQRTKDGDHELYLFYDDIELNLGTVASDPVKGVEYSKPIICKQGDIINIPANIVHSARNPNKDRPADFVFCCPEEELQSGKVVDNHLKNTSEGGNRIMYDKFLPKHYPQAQ